MFKKKKTSLPLILGAAVLLIAGGAVAYWLFVQRQEVVGEVPIGAQLIPQDALLAVSMSTEPEQWQQLREYGTPETQAILDKQLATLRDTFLTANGYNYQQDIQPWLGKEVTIATLASRTSTATSNPTKSAPGGAVPLAQHPTIMVLPIEDPLKAQQLLSKPKSPSSPKFVERTYKGIQIRETRTAKSQNLSTTVLGRSLVVTTDPKATERAIDTYKGEPSLAATPGYPQALGQIQSAQPFGQLYLNVPVAAATAAASSARALSSENLAQAQQKQGIAATATLEPEGMSFKGISWFKPNSQKKLIVENNAKNMPSRLPADTLLMMSGGNLQQLWQDYAEGAQSNPLTPIKPENVRAGLKSTTGLDLEQDLLPWMKGEFSLALIPKPPEIPSELGAGVVLMVQASDRDRAEKTFNQLDEVMSKKYQFQVQQTELGGQPIVNWTSQLGGLTATHGWLDGNVAFMTLGAPLAQVVVPKPKATLEDNELFKNAVFADLSPKNGHFFIDVDRTINDGNLALPQFAPQQKTLLAGIRAIKVSAAIRNERSSRFDIFVLLKKVGKPALIPSPSLSPKSSPSSTASGSPSLKP
ncbi:MAG: DUF3352 domain-containing protein [Aphanothece sp. CMT-3BRIN-NPC111]|jgi:hypothetical protein|nr:DUF3352 domain-containing protein [Aphanothece sp. CMT-3BRIN-NPC111]